MFRETVVPAAPTVPGRVTSEEVKGLDTIRGLVGEPPKEILVPRVIVKTENMLMQGWNACHIAIIPFCFKCQEPLIWVNPPDKDGRIFRCGKCERVWKLSEES